jgi:Domain of unknown function (DUF1788)
VLPFNVPSFTKGLAELRGFLETNPSRIDMYGQRPFGVLIYQPKEEFVLLEAIERMQMDLADSDHTVKIASFAALAEQVIGASLEEQAATWQDLYDNEPEFGPQALGQGIVDMLDHERALAQALVNAAHDLRPDRDALILTRAGFLYPHYRVNPLLEALGNYKDMKVATILCYPGRREGETGLSFMGQQEVLRGYRQRLF